MGNRHTLTTAALCCTLGTMTQAQDLGGIGFVDFTSDVAEVGFADAKAALLPNAGAVALFIDPDDGTVRISPLSPDPVVSDSLSGLIGFAIRGGYDAITLTQSGIDVDVDGDGEFVSLSACLTSEGLRLEVSSLEGAELWSQTRYLPYDTEPTCQQD